MGTPAVALDPNAPSPAQKALAGQTPASKLLADLQQFPKQQAKVESEEAGHEQQYADTNKRLDTRDADALSAMKPFQPLPQPKEQTTSPEKAWGSMAMLMAVIGSAFTREPLTTAMNAAAAAIKGFHQADTEQFDHDFKTWQVANQNAKDAWEWQQKQYEAILSQDERERGTALREQQAQDRVTEARLRAFQMQVGDDRMAALLDESHRYHTGELAQRAQAEVDRRNNYKHQWDKYSDQVDAIGQIHAAIGEWKANFKAKNGRDPTHEEQIVKYGQLMREVKGTPPITQAKAADLNNKALDRLANKGPNSIGGAYMAARQNKEKLDNAIRLHDARGVISQGAGLDAFVQGQNNNRAVRAFLVKMFQSDMGALDKATVEWNKVFHHGGAITPDMLYDMQKLSDAYDKFVEQSFADSITSEQWAAYHTPGQNPGTINPDFFVKPQLGLDGQPYRTPSPEAVAKLKAESGGRNGKQTWVQFDQYYGQGAAAEYAGENPE